MSRSQRPGGNDGDPADAPEQSVAEHLAEQFARWELRGRGWLLWDDPVRPEPPFAAFRGYRLPQITNVDDGRQHTLLSGLIQWASRALSGADPTEVVGTDEEEPGEDATDLTGAVGSFDAELQVTLPIDTKIADGVADRLLLGLGACGSTLSFEIIGLADRIVLQLACAERDRQHARAQLQAHFPAATIEDGGEFLASHWEDLDSSETVVVEFGLSREFMLPLGTDLRGDLLVQMAGTLEQVREGELAMLQIVFEPVRHPWAAAILRAVATPEGEGLFGGAVDILAGAKEKISRPLYAAVVRVACRADGWKRAWELARRLGHALDALADPVGNELIALDPDDYDSEALAMDVPLRRSRRSGMILSGAELSALVHLPGIEVQSAKLRRQQRRTKAAPACVINRPWFVGVNEHAGQSRRVTLDREQRVRHTHVIGASGTGKSTLLQSMILQDVCAGEGVAVLDPHGDLIDEIVARIPPEREQDVVLFDPADEEFPVGFNILAAHTETEKTLLSSDLVGVFRRLSTSWGDQMNSVLGNGVLAFLESDRGGTLADLRRFLVERPFREQFLKTVRDPQVVYYWQKEFSLLVGRPQGPVLTRLDAFLRPKAVRHVVAQKENRLDFADMMDRGKIFLARLSHGAIGEENAHLLGALLVSKFHQIALGRQRIEEKSRRHFWLYIDEFQHFATPSMASLLSGVRKYRLGLVLAHQELHQLDSRSPEVASAVTGNAHTRICFRLGDQDARKLEGGFASFEARDLQSLGVGEAICRVERSDQDFNLRTEPLAPVDPEQGAVTRDRVVASSRQKYSVERSAVEEQLQSGFEPPKAEPPAQAALIPEESVPTPTTAPAPANVEPKLPHVSRARPKEQAPRNMPEPEPMGRGGPEHKYIQQMIKQWGDGMGYRSTIEKPILDGAGSIDIALEKGSVAIACQVSVTTSSEWEAENVRKCLKAKFSPVIIVAIEAKRLAKLRKEIGTLLAESECAAVQFLSPDELFAHLEELELLNLTVEQKVRGYKVKRTATSLDPAESENRRKAVSRVVADALKRLRSRKK